MHTLVLYDFLMYKNHSIVLLVLSRLKATFSANIEIPPIKPISSIQLVIYLVVHTDPTNSITDLLIKSE